MRQITPSPNNARSYARELPIPTAWTNQLALAVYNNLSAPGTIVDLFLVEAQSRHACIAFPGTPRGYVHTDGCVVCAGLYRVYGNSPHVIAYRGWGEPSATDDAESYLVRHIANAYQQIGGVPYVNGTVAQ